MEENRGVGRSYGVLYSEKSLLFVKWKLPNLGDGKVRGHYSIMSLFPPSPDIPDKGDCPESKSNKYTAHFNTESESEALTHVRLFMTPWTAAHQALHPWDFPDKSTGVGCYCLLR